LFAAGGCVVLYSVVGMTKQPEALRYEFEGGKYIAFIGQGTCTVTRHGELWRDLTGDKFVGCLFSEIDRLHEEVEVLMKALSKACGDDEETVLRAINAQRPAYDGSDEASPNHYCHGQIVHLPNGEECSACGKATGETE
jgi:hypothetical protein